jgi:hypothetical protein
MKFIDQNKGPLMNPETNLDTRGDNILKKRKIGRVLAHTLSFGLF